MKLIAALLILIPIFSSYAESVAAPIETQVAKLRQFPLAGLKTFTFKLYVITAGLTPDERKQTEETLTALFIKDLESQGLSLQSAPSADPTFGYIECFIHFTDYGDKATLRRWRVKVSAFMNNPRSNEVQAMPVWQKQDEDIVDSNRSLPTEKLSELLAAFKADLLASNKSQK